MADPDEPGREPMPTHIQPMLAKLVDRVPVAQGWAYEVKWDGIRVIAYIDGGRLRLETRRGNDVTAQYPELTPLSSAVGSLQAILDGEIVALDRSGRPSFERLQQRFGLAGDRAVARATEFPAAYVVFDLLYLDGHSALHLPYGERRRLLEALELSGPAWSAPGCLQGDGEAVLAATRAQGLEGIVAKRLGSRYEPGRRSGAWVKVKNRQHQRFVVGGWVQRENARTPTVGALLLGYYRGRGDEPEQRLAFAGRVGTGFTDDVAAALGDALVRLRADQSPFEIGTPLPGAARHTVPALVVDVEFLEWTADGVLRQPSFKGLRPDVDPGDVRRE